MNKLTKIFSVLTVALLLLSQFTGLVKAKEEHQTTVRIHKIVMNKEDMAAHDAEKEYGGTQITNIEEFFSASAKERAGIAFRAFKVVEAGVAGAKKGSELNADLDRDTYYVEVAGGPYLTADDGVDVTLGEGTFTFVEDKQASTYVGDAGEELAASKAIPFTLTLPMTKADGTGLFSTTDKLHVYPKNTEEKPEIEKTFGDGTKETKDYTVGDEIPYKVTTTIKASSEYQTLIWRDTMSAGLDFVRDSLVVDGAGLVAADYTLTQVQNGFILELKESGLTKVKEAAANNDVTITLNYKGILNEDAVVDTEIPNDVTLDYGNRPSQDSTPKPTTPSNGRITVSKTWGPGTTAEDVTFDVYEVATGKKVGEIVLTAGQASASLDGLDDAKEYIAVERKTTANTVPVYGTPTAGNIPVTNKPNENPKPLKPEPVKVITYGRRFIKVDSSDKSPLAGAEFKVLNESGQYLALKDAAAQAAEKAAYEAAEAAYQKAVADKASDIAAKKATRDEAYKAFNFQWTFVTSEAEGFTFVTGQDGKFEVKGLEEGSYKLKETKAPAGYALLQDMIDFTVGPNTWTDTSAKAIDGHTMIDNKKVTIPQTGGIGTLIFTVTGLSVMLVAFVIMKKRQAEEA